MKYIIVNHAETPKLTYNLDEDEFRAADRAYLVHPDGNHIIYVNGYAYFCKEMRYTDRWRTSV